MNGSASRHSTQLDTIISRLFVTLRCDKSADAQHTGLVACKIAHLPRELKIKYDKHKQTIKQNAFFYTSCTELCPQQGASNHCRMTRSSTADLSASALPHKLVNSFAILLVSSMLDVMRKPIIVLIGM